MAADLSTPIHKPPKTFTLSGKTFDCYRAGEQMGKGHACNTAAENLRELKKHQWRQLSDLRDALLNNSTYPIPDDHPLRGTIDSLPTLAVGLEKIAVQFDKEGAARQAQGQQIMGAVAAQDTAQEARWRPPLRAWALLTLALAVATTLSTLAAIYASRASW